MYRKPCLYDCIPSVGKRRSKNEHARVVWTSARHVKRHDTSRQSSRPSQRLSVACDIPSIQLRGLLQEQAVEATAAKNHRSVDWRGDWVCAMPSGHWEARQGVTTNYCSSVLCLFSLCSVKGQLSNQKPARFPETGFRDTLTLLIGGNGVFPLMQSP